MPRLTVYIAQAGVATTAGNSFAGHLWLSASDGTNKFSKGFSPVVSGSAFGPGTTRTEDDATYMVQSNSGIRSVTIDITAQQFQLLLDITNESAFTYGISMHYNALTNSCVDVAWKMLQSVGLNPSAFEGGLLPSTNRGAIVTQFAFLALVQIDPAFSQAQVGDWVMTEIPGGFALDRIRDESGNYWWNVKPDFTGDPSTELVRNFMRREPSQMHAAFIEHLERNVNRNNQIQ